MIVVLVIAGPLFGLVALALLNSGLKSADRPADPQSSIALTSLGGSFGGLFCRVQVTNPGAEVALVSVYARPSSPIGVLTLGSHDRRHATLKDRKRSESLFDRQIGSVAPNNEAHWDVPLAAPTERGPAAVTVEVLVSAGGDRTLRQVHRLLLRTPGFRLTPRVTPEDRGHGGSPNRW